MVPKSNGVRFNVLFLTVNFLWIHRTVSFCHSHTHWHNGGGTEEREDILKVSHSRNADSFLSFFLLLDWSSFASVRKCLWLLLGKTSISINAAHGRDKRLRHTQGYSLAKNLFMTCHPPNHLNKVPSATTLYITYSLHSSNKNNNGNALSFCQLSVWGCINFQCKRNHSFINQLW